MPADDQIPDCPYQNDAVLVKPNKPTPSHTIRLSNLDSQAFLRFSIKYLYLFVNAVPVDSLKASLSATLFHYYPLAGRLRSSPLETDQGDHRLEVECNGEGAVFAEAFMDYSVEEFLEVVAKPNRSWRKLLYRVEVKSFLDVPPLVVQVTKLRCGGMILCTAINHCLCDGIGTSQFLSAWAHLTTKPNTELPIAPFHFRHVFEPRCPPQVTFAHPGFTRVTSENDTSQHSILQFLQSHPLIPTSFTFNHSQILSLKKQCSPSTKCTTFEALASHTWRSWVRSLVHLSPNVHVKLLFSVNVRKRMKPRGTPEGYYGNGFVLGCAETTVNNLVTQKLNHGIGLIQQAKMDITDDYVRSVVDLLEDKMMRTDLTTSFVISQWSRLGLEEVDFGEGKPLHMGSLTSDVYCLFLPVVGDPNVVRVSVSVPQSVVERFESYMMQLDEDENGELSYECNAMANAIAMKGNA